MMMANTPAPPSPPAIAPLYAEDLKAAGYLVDKIFDCARRLPRPVCDGRGLGALSLIRCFMEQRHQMGAFQ
jgi:hypothetical protein